jgi:SAM-dependent methyltransferase
MLRLKLDFPSLQCPSRAEYLEVRRGLQDTLDTRWLYEQSLATREDRLALEGTCPLCMNPAAFDSPAAGGEALADGRRVPNWREAQICGCALGLNSRQRAVAHFLESRVGIGDWTRVLLLGPPERFVELLEPRVGKLIVQSRLNRSFEAKRPSYRLNTPDGGVHLVLAIEYLNRIPPLNEALAEIVRVLAPGGSLVFTAPFRVEAAHTRSYVAHLPRLRGALPADFGAEVHELGWDILEALKAAGFAHAAAHLYWSEELGYLGPFNFVFSAWR